MYNLDATELLEAVEQENDALRRALRRKDALVRHLEQQVATLRGETQPQQEGSA